MPSVKQNLPMLSPALEIVRGDGMGQAYELGERSSYVLGRGEDCDIPLLSEGISRKHASLERRGAEWWIVDNQSKNGILVNGLKVQETAIKAGDQIQIGTCLVRFQSPTDSLPIAVEEAAEQMPELGVPAIAPKKKPNKRLIIYLSVILLLAGLWFMSQGEESTQDTEAEKKAGEKLARDFKAAEAPNLENKSLKETPGLADPTLKSAEHQLEKMDWGNDNLKKAEEFFRRGQKEYFSKNYHRAIEDFQTALSVSRGHELADKYLRLAVYEAEQEAKKNMEIAVKYFDSLQYQRAIYHFSEVINLMAHRPNEAIVKESERYIEVSRRRLHAAELFP